MNSLLLYIDITPFFTSFLNKTLCAIAGQPAYEIMATDPDPVNLAKYDPWRP